MQVYLLKYDLYANRRRRGHGYYSPFKIYSKSDFFLENRKILRGTNKIHIADKELFRNIFILAPCIL